MKKMPQEIMDFFQEQGFVIVSTIGADGLPHSSCKGVIKIEEGKVYLIDLYRKSTYHNLLRNPAINITAVDEHKFKGYCLKGKAKVITQDELNPQILKAWEERLAGRITRRVIKNLKEQKGHPRHPEALMPKPQYLIAMEVQGIVDLAPRHLK